MPSAPPIATFGKCHVRQRNKTENLSNAKRKKKLDADIRRKYLRFDRCILSAQIIFSIGNLDLKQTKRIW